MMTWFGWGANASGQLFAEPCEILPVTKLNLAEEMLFIHGGANNSIAIDANHTAHLSPKGEILFKDILLTSFQWNRLYMATTEGTLVCTNIDRIFVNTIPISTSIKKLVSGLHQTFALTHDNNLYKISEFAAELIAKDILDVVCGKKWHVRRSSNNSIFCDNPILNSLLAENNSTDDHLLAAGWNHVVLAKDRTIQCFSLNNFLGNLGVEGSAKRHHAFSVPSPVKKLLCGTEHTAALLEDGQLWTWGWNEHGTCDPFHISHSSPPKCVMNGVHDIGISYAGIFARIKN